MLEREEDNFASRSKLLPNKKSDKSLIGEEDLYFLAQGGLREAKGGTEQVRSFVTFLSGWLP